MGRVKAFDEELALDKAMRLFWRQGYSNTSLKELLAEMDMLNGSFYHCFKDKKNLFQKSLVHYNQRYTVKRKAALMSDDNFSIGIRALFSEIFKTLESKEEPFGCLILNSMVDEVTRDDDLKQFLSEDFYRFVNFMTERVQLSIDLKYTQTSLSAEQITLILITYIQGVFSISNASIDIALLKSQTDAVLAAFNL